MRGVFLPNMRRPVAAAGMAAGVALFALAFAVLTRDQPALALAVPAVLGTAVLCARRPVIAIAALLILSGTFGSLQAFGIVSAGPVVDLLLAGLWASVLISHAINVRERPWWIWPGMAILVLYIAITFFEIVTAATIGVGFRSFRYSSWYMLTVPLIALAGWSLRTYVRISRAMIVVALLVGAYAVLRLIIGPAASEREFALQGAGSFNVIDDQLALIGSFPSRHSLAFWGVCAVPFCLAATLTQRRAWKLVAAAAAGLCVAAVLGTEVRTAVPALVAGGGTVVVLYLLSGSLRGGTLPRALTATVLAITVAAGLFSTVVGENASRYEAILSPSGDVSYEHRITKWTQAVEDIEDAPFGKGLGSAGLVQELSQGPYVTLGSYAIDNSYLKIAYEQGFPILALFMAAMLALLVGLARRILRMGDELVRGIAIGGTGTLVAALSMFTTGLYIENLTSLALWIPVGAAIGAIGAERAGALRTSPREQSPPPAAEAAPPAA